MSKVIGIDLGTTNSAVAVMEGGKAKIIHSQEGRNVIPSVVDPEKRIIGDVAKRQMVMNPKKTIFSAKRLMGRRLSDESVQRDKELLTYDTVAGRDDMAMIEVDGKQYTPQEIGSMVLQKIKADAEAYLGEKVERAVITVPAYFDDAQRQATKQAGEIAGLTVERIINEPTAAALAYGLDKSHAHTIAVYDMGGGTFDITILELGDGVFEVKSTNGDTHLGGDDFDQVLIHHIADEFKKEHGVDLRKDSQALQRLKDAAEKAKVELSTATETDVNLPFITVKDGQPQHLVMKISRSQFESLVDSLITRSFEPVKSALSDAGLTAKDIDEVVLVGGMTRMPKVIAEVESFFGKEPNRSVNPDEVVAIGAAIQAGVLTGEAKDVVLLDVTPLTLGVETMGGVMTALIERNTTVPTSKSETFSTAADNQTQVEIHILQGERPMAAQNKSLGRFILEGIPPAPRGVPQVEVSFDLDANGILEVTAKDKTSGKEQSIKITGSTGLSEEEITKMKEDAEQHAEEDKQAREKIEATNRAESMIYTAEKSLKDAGEAVPAEVKTEIEDKIKEVRTAIESAGTEEIDAKTGELTTVLQKIAEHMQKAQEQQAQAADAAPSPEGDEASPDSDKKDKKKKDTVEEGEVVE